MNIKNKIKTILIFLKNKEILKQFILDIVFYLYIIISPALLYQLVLSFKRYEQMFFISWLVIFITLLVFKNNNKKNRRDNLEQ